jgi:uncharacterized ubiquitin-like protein YukD
LEWILKEAVMPQSNYYPAICLEWLRQPRETSVRIAGILAEVWTEHRPNTGLQHLNLGPQTGYSDWWFCSSSERHSEMLDYYLITSYYRFVLHPSQFIIHNWLTIQCNNMCGQKASLKKPRTNRHIIESQHKNTILSDDCTLNQTNITHNDTGRAPYNRGKEIFPVYCGLWTQRPLDLTRVLTSTARILGAWVRAFFGAWM